MLAELSQKGFILEVPKLVTFGGLRMMQAPEKGVPRVEELESITVNRPRRRGTVFMRSSQAVLLYVFFCCSLAR